MRRLPALLVALVAAAVVAPTATAHAKLVSTSPADGATLAEAPRVVQVRFDDAVVVGPDNAVVRNGSGSVLAGKPRLAAGGRRLILPVRNLRDGDYSVRWRILSDDGHVEGGVFAFRVGSRAGPTPPVSVLRAESTRPSAADVFSRWLYLGGILLAGGAGLFRIAVARIDGRAAANSIALALVAVVLGGSSLLHSAGSGGSTRFGRVLEVAVVVALLGATAAALATVYPRLLTGAFLAGAVLLAAPSLSGHAVNDGRLGPLGVAADLGHVVAAAFWIGGLVQLAFLLRSDGAGRAARRFSQLALPATALIAATGLLRALDELARVSQLWTTGYGRAILVKSALFAVLIGLGWTSRKRLAARGPLRRTAFAELCVLACVVGAVAVLTALEPGRDLAAAAQPKPPARGQPAAPRPGSLVLAKRSHDLVVAVAVDKATRVTATIVGPDGKGLDGLDVQLIAGGPTSGARNRGTPCGFGCYTATLPFRAPTRVAVNFVAAGRPRSVGFALPLGRADGTAFLRRAGRAFRSARSAVYVERLSSGTGPPLVTTWKLQAPDRLSYAIRGGAAGIVIAKRRWDRSTPAGRWMPSETTTLRQPEPTWGEAVANARVLARSPSRVRAAWVNPTIPAWFEATFDARTARPLTLRMTAAAHFMQHRYGAFDAAVIIAPPME